MKRLLITFLAPFVVASSLNAAVDMFLQLDGIKGESKDTKYPETIEIDSFSWGASNTGAASGGGGGAGKVILQDVHFVAKVSKASPQLLLACAEGRHIPKAVLYGRKAGDDGRFQEYLTITIEDVFIASVNQTGRTPTSAADDLPTEEVAFYYNKITFVYIAEDGTETIGSAVRTPTPAQ